jgi:type III secretion system YscQ/HrcQ family protein
VTEYKPLPDISELTFDLPELSAAETAAATTLPVLESSFEFGAGPIDQVRLTLGSGVNPGPIAEEIQLLVGGSAFTIRLEQPVLAPLLSRSGYTGDADVIGQDTSLAGLVLEHFLTPALDRLEAALGLSARINRLSDATGTEDPAVLRVCFRLESALWDAPCLGEVVATSATAADLLRARLSHALPVPGPARLDLPLMCSLSGPDILIRRADLAALLPGDGLLLDPVLDLQGPLYLRLGHQKMARVDWRDTRLVVTGLANQVSPSEESRTMQGFDDDSITIDELPVTISLELDRIQVSFASLSDLRVGSVIPFNSGKPQKVRVLANGRAFASADLLQIDGRLGIRITDLATPRAE